MTAPLVPFSLDTALLDGSARSILDPSDILGTLGRRSHPLWRVLARPHSMVGFDAAGLLAGLALVGGIQIVALMVVAASLALMAATGAYRHRLTASVANELLPLAGQIALPMLALGLVDPGDTRRLAVELPAAFVGLVAARVSGEWVRRLARSRGALVQPTLIVGAGRLGATVAEILRDHPEYGLEPVGFVDGFSDDHLPLPVLADLEGLRGVISRFNIERVIVAFGSHRGEDMVKVLRACSGADLEVHVVPRLFELGVATGPTGHDVLWGLPLQRAPRLALRTPAWRIKRIMDLAVAGLGMALVSPVFVLAALAVKLSSPGPVFFRQRRLGQRGEVVEVLKFRTMPVNNDSDTTWSVDADRRLTAVGAFLRRSSIDELPQLINILRGDMSLVGPRPERPHFADQFERAVHGYGDRARVPVGLTGWAQIHGLRGDTSIEERARFDNWYIEHWSPWLDLVIMVRTVTHVLRCIVE